MHLLRDLKRWLKLLIPVIAFVVAGTWWWVSYGSIPLEERLANMVVKLKEAIEKKQYGEVMRYISPRYKDSAGVTYEDIKNALQDYVRNPDLHVRIEITAMTVYSRSNTAVIDTRMGIMIIVGEHSYSISPINLTIFMQRELIRWRIVAVEGWQRVESELPIEEIVH